MTKTALILGPSGRFGRHAAQAFWNAGWRVRPFDRKTGDLVAEAKAADIIVNAWNPPYQHWAKTLLKLIDSLIEAGRQSGTPILHVGNIYVYGADAPSRLAHDTPWRARNPLGQIRREIESRLRDSGLHVVVLRSGDFLDTEASGGMFDRVMTAKLSQGRFVYPGRDFDTPHAWAYLPDMAVAAVGLADRIDTLPQWDDVMFPGYTLTARDMAAALGRITGQTPRLSRMAWWPLRAMTPVEPVLRGVIEMRYLWDKPHWIDGTQLADLLPGLRGTPVDEALRSALGQSQVDPDKGVSQRVLSA